MSTGPAPYKVPKNPQMPPAMQSGVGSKSEGRELLAVEEQVSSLSTSVGDPAMQPRKAEMLWEGKVPHHGLLMGPP